jgi:hypothetical protein
MLPEGHSAGETRFAPNSFAWQTQIATIFWWPFATIFHPTPKRIISFAGGSERGGSAFSRHGEGTLGPLCVPNRWYGERWERSRVLENPFTIGGLLAA